MKISEKIINIRNDNNLTQEELAETLGVSRQTVSNWENNKCYPDIATLILISEKFNVSFDNLLKEDEKMVKDLDKKINSSKYKKIVIVIFIILFLLIMFYLGYKLFLLNYYDNSYNNKIYEKYFANLEQITIEENNLANYKFYDLNIYIPENTYKESNNKFLYMIREEAITLYKFNSSFYEFYNTGEYYKNIDFEKVFEKIDINHPVDLIRYFEILYDRTPNILWSKFDLELAYLMKNYVLSETEYGAKYYKRYYFCNNLEGMITEINNGYEVEIYHEDVTYVIYIDKVYMSEETINDILNSIYFG